MWANLANTFFIFIKNLIFSNRVGGSGKAMEKGTILNGFEENKNHFFRIRVMVYN